MHWVQGQTFTHAVIATDSMSTLAKIRTGQLYSDWTGPLRNSHLKKLTWLFCPGHAGVRGNERADKLAGKAPLSRDSLTLDPPAVLRLVKNVLQETETKPESFTLHLLLEKGVKQGEGRWMDLCGRQRRFHNQLLVEDISHKTLEWTLRNRAEQVWVCSDCNEADSSVK